MLTLDKAPKKSLALSLMVSLCAGIMGCSGEVTPEIIARVDGCRECGMVIDRVDEACGWVHDGEFVTFCSPGCLLEQHDGLRATGKELPVSISFADYNGSGFSVAENTAFLLTDHVPTVMNARVITFASTEAASAMRQHEDEIITDWIGYRVYRGRPDVVVETVFTNEGMEPESVGVAKGEIVLWRATGRGLEEDLNFSIGGYPEVGPATLAAGDGMTEIRFLATRPGAGFPIERTDDGRAIGMLKVSGAHTADEAAQ